MNNAEPLREGHDFYFNENGLCVFTAAYLLRRGFCCESGCRHCPYGYKPLSTPGGKAPLPGQGTKPKP